MASPLIVSINGSDNVGKTTQIALLPPHYSIRLLGSLHNVGGKLADLLRSGSLMSWWWTSSDEDFVTAMGLTVQPEQVSILLKFDCPVGEAVIRTLEKESDPVDDRYREYQRFLHAHITHQVTCGRYQHIVEADGSRLEVQNRIRKILSSLTSVHVHRAFTPLLSSLNQVYILGGLSESGKSALANALQSAKVSLL